MISMLKKCVIWNIFKGIFMKKIFLLFFIVIVLLGSSLVVLVKKDDGLQVQLDNYYFWVKIEIIMGDIVVEFDRRCVFIMVNNFFCYVDKCVYEDIIFYCIVFGFVVQGGGYIVDFDGKLNFFDIFNELGNGLINDLYIIVMV